MCRRRCFLRRGSWNVPALDSAWFPSRRSLRRRSKVMVFSWLDGAWFDKAMLLLSPALILGTLAERISEKTPRHFLRSTVERVHKNLARGLGRLEQIRVQCGAEKGCRLGKHAGRSGCRSLTYRSAVDRRAQLAGKTSHGIHGRVAIVGLGHSPHDG